MCQHCEDLTEIPEKDWRLMVNSSLADHLNMIEDDAEEADRRQEAWTGAMGVLVDTQCAQGIEVFVLREELTSLRELLRKVSEIIIDPSTDTTALASRLATLKTARTARTTGDHVRETYRTGESSNG